MIKSHNSKRIPHIVDRYLATIDGNLNDRYEPKIYLEKHELRRIEGLLRKRKGGKRVVGFVPGASKKTKMWEIEKIKELALQLVEKNNAFIVFLGDMNEISIAKDTKEMLDDACLDLTGKTSIRELALALQCCDVLFTTDSGPMHIAVSVGTPIVSIFGPTVQEFGFRPYDERSVIISKSLPCRPCSLHGTDKCPLGHHNCMKLIEVEEVRKEIEKLLYNSEGRREMREEDNRLKT
jgi:heptosyltransferase-2